MASEYDLGDTVRLTATFASTDGAPANPTTVRFWVKAPSSTVLTAQTSTEWTQPSTGTYTFDLVPSATGVWSYRVSSTGTIVSSEDGQFIVLTPLVAST